MPANYVLLGEVTLGASAASVTFSNIPQSGYTDLKVVGSLRTDRATGSVATVSLRLNSITTSVYSSKELAGTGSATDNGTFTNVAPTSLQVGRISQSTDTANTFGSLEVYIPNYAGSTAKSASCESVQENNATAAYTQMTAWLCTDTAAINALTFTTNSGTNFVANSTFYLYGLAAVGTTPVIAPFASGGDVIQNDGTYWIHTFLSSGTFTPAKALTCDYLVIAGGGGGGSNRGGGGGAGGLRSTVTATGGGGTLESALSLTAQAYSVTIGAGGAGAINNGLGTSGSNSVFSTITSTAGGGGGFQTTAAGPGITGGSGGGGGGNGIPGTSQASSSAGSGTANQGFAGGTGANSGGGGGGASAVGSAVASSTTQVGANGGAGLAVAITGTSVTYAGGGGGAGETGGGSTTGGGGAGGNNSAGTSGTANLGGGGGGGSDTATLNGGTGGSGIVIVRYPIA